MLGLVPFNKTNADGETLAQTLIQSVKGRASLSKIIIIIRFCEGFNLNFLNRKISWDWFHLRETRPIKMETNAIATASVVLGDAKKVR